MTSNSKPIQKTLFDLPYAEPLPKKQTYYYITDRTKKRFISETEGSLMVRSKEDYMIKPLLFLTRWECQKFIYARVNTDGSWFPARYLYGDW